MCEDKPARYTQMVKSLIDKADMYASKVGGDISAWESIAVMMCMVDEIYVEIKKEK